MNLVFNVEGEHGLMSPNYPQFYQKYKHKIEDAAAVFWPMANQNSNGRVIVKMGDNGMMGFQLECSGKLWGRGPMEKTLHNADAGIVDNNTWRLMNAICSMTKKDGSEIAIARAGDVVKKEPIELTQNIRNKHQNTIHTHFNIYEFLRA